MKYLKKLPTDFKSIQLIPFIGKAHNMYVNQSGYSPTPIISAPVGRLNDSFSFLSGALYLAVNYSSGCLKDTSNTSSTNPNCTIAR